MDVLNPDAPKQINRRAIYLVDTSREIDLDVEPELMIVDPADIPILDGKTINVFTSVNGNKLNYTVSPSINSQNYMQAIQMRAGLDFEKVKKDLRENKGMTSENGIGQVLDLLRRELPVEDIASIFVFEMFRTGVINPDLMLLLIEPTILTLIFIADYADIEVVIHETDTMDSSKSEEGDELAAMIQKDTGGIADASLEEAPMSMGLEEAVVEQVEGEENGI